MTEFRPSWEEYFLAIAFIISSRSRDIETKHGAIITDKNNIILGTGYNSFIKNINDNLIPKTRPGKYPFMIHAEENALLNCKILPREVMGGGTVYITGQPCNNCFQKLIQGGVERFIIAKRQGTKLETKETIKIFKFLVKQTKVTIKYINFNKNWILNYLNHF